MTFNIMDFAAGAQQKARINGHEISYHLLDVGEELEVSRLTAPYNGTYGVETAVKSATFALSVDAIDGSMFYADIAPDSPGSAEERFKKACGFYRWWVEAWFDIYTKKREERARDLEEFKKKSEA